MSDLINAIKGKKGFLSKKPVSSSEIEKSENALNLKFAPDYKEYLKMYGEVSYFGHELTGILDSSRLNVVDVTTEERSLNASIPLDMYVIEQTNIDGIVIWQNGDGEVFQSAPRSGIEKKYESLAEYIQKS